MNEGEALFRAVRESPEDDTPRLVYADWLEENGQPERAEFVRLQCERWSLYATVAEARQRARALERRFGDGWYAELPAPDGVQWGSLFVRGFVDAVRVDAGGAEVFGRLEAVFASAPVSRLTLDPLDQKLLPDLLALPALARLAHLALPWYAPGSINPYPYTVASRVLLALTAQRLPQTKFQYPPPAHR